MLQIVIEKSVPKQRIVYKKNAELVFNYLMMYFLGWILPVMTLYLLVFPSKANANAPIFLFIFFIAIDAWIILGLFFTNKLFVLKGKTFDENKEAVMQVLNDKYPDIKFSSGNPNLIRGKKEVGFLRDRILTIILNENNIYINILNTYRGNSFSFFHGFYNYIKSRNLASSFNNSINLA